MSRLRPFAAFACVAFAQGVLAGAFTFTNNGTGIVAHPTGYTGSAGAAAVTVCLDPAQPPIGGTAQAEQPLRNVVAVWNGMAGANGNIATSSNVPPGQFDIESVLLHEFGHCIGLAHPNLGSESCAVVGPGCTGTEPVLNATKSTTGPNGSFNALAGADGRFGSADDVRLDDENLHYFQNGVNNPFLAPPATVDASTFTRSLALLPPGNLYAVNADRTVAQANFGIANTEAVMQQLLVGSEARRVLSFDDVATRRYANAGLDRSQAGAADNYTLNASFITTTTGCNVIVRFNTNNSFGICSTQGAFLGANDIRITSGVIDMNVNVAWFFNQVPVGPSDLLFRNGFE